MSEEVVETTSQGLFSRLGSAIGGIFVGILMLLAAFPLLFWNEGNSVKTYLALQEGASSAQHVDADTVDPANDGKLVHTNGEATTTDILTDSTFGVELSALALKRSVEMYQWVEKVESKTNKKVGGKKETVKTYSYTKEWSSKPIDSSSFKTTEGHVNPSSMLYDSESWRASTVTLGAFTLDNTLASGISNWSNLAVTEDMRTKANLESQADTVKIQSGSYYFGKDPAAPTVGDMKVSFKVVKPGPVSVLGGQQGSTLGEYTASNGYSIHQLVTGTKSMDEMFEAAEQSNTIWTWVLRGVGFAMMFFGITAILGPIRVLSDFIPFLGSIVGFGIGVLAFFGAVVCTLPTIALAWLFYRPVLAIILLSIAAMALAAVVVTVLGLIKAHRSRQAAAAA